MKYKKNIKFIIIVIITILITGCGKQLTFPKIEEGIFSDRQKKAYGEKRLKITTGDTLKSISDKYKVSIREIIKFNNLKKPYILKPGKTLSIPKPVRYKINKGDSLFKIAKCSRINIEDIVQRNNNLQERRLIVGKFINLPYFAKIEYCKNIKRKSNSKSKKSNYNKKLFKWPVIGRVIATFGIKNSGRRNDGINIKAPPGSPVRAAKSGKVIYRGNELPAWGNLILVKHNNGWTTAYAHLDKFYVKI
ncbi:MAG: Murein hydrolase activator NlpD, partial [Alphaproteobacteria bacterium MarineAlpha9_Bin4]